MLDFIKLTIARLPKKFCRLNFCKIYGYDFEYEYDPDGIHVAMHLALFK